MLFKEKYYFKGLIFVKIEEIYFMKYILCNKFGCLCVFYVWFLCLLCKVRGDYVIRKCCKGVSVGWVVDVIIGLLCVLFWIYVFVSWIV